MATEPRPFSDAVYKALTGRTRKLETGSISDRIAFLEKKHGSLSAVAKETGISRSTLRRWKDGKAKPKLATEKKVVRALRETLVPEGRRKRVRNSTGRPDYGPKTPTGPGSGNQKALHGGITITADVAISSDQRANRRLYLGQNLDDLTGAELITAFLAGDDARVDQIINQALGNYFGSPAGWEITHVTDISFWPIK